MYKFTLITIAIICLMVFEVYAKQTININDNPAAGYVRASWYNSPAFFLVDNNGFNKYENDNVQLQNYLKYLGKNIWIQVLGQTYYVYNENLNVIDSIRNPYAANMGRMIDWHDVIQLANGHYLLLLFDARIMDLSQIVDGGKKDANVIGNLLVETDRTGTIYWEWSTFDQFDIIDIVDFYDLSMNIIDHTHINSLQETPDGNIVMSVRNFDEIVKINKSTGEIIWRIGGSESKKNQYTFINDTRNGFTGFSHQHSAQILPNGNLILLDNGWLNPLQQTRAVEYQLDHTNKTATKVWEYYHPNGVFAGTMGSVEVLPNGNRLVNFGRKYITEVRPDGNVAWELEYFDGNGLYHATRVIEYMDAVYQTINSTGSYFFKNFDYNTGVELQINSIQGDGNVSVERHRYLPQVCEFQDTTFSLLMPYRYVINQYGIRNFTGNIKFDVSTLPELTFPKKARLYWREKEGSGEFKEIECFFSQSDNSIIAQINKFGEFVIGVSILSKPTAIKPNELMTTPISVNFEWTKVKSAVNYQLQISRNENMTDILLDTILTNIGLVYNNFYYNSTYFWAVRAMNEKDTSQWSNISRFTTQISSPILNYPINQAYGVKFYDHLRWFKVQGAKSYKVELSNSQTFSIISNFFVGMTDTFVFIPSLKHNTRYFWRVYAIKGKDTVPTQMPFSFTTNMERPFLSLPSNEDINVPLNQQLKWNNVDGADLYLVQISHKPKFDDSPTINDSSHTTNIAIKELINETYYYWRVRAVRTTDSSDWSEVFKFRTELIIPKPFYPMDKSENIEVNPIFKWKENPRSITYQIQISKSLEFTDLIIDSIVYIPYFSIHNLKTNTYFYWRVRAIDNIYHSSWSDSYLFKTGDNYIVQEPLLLLPNNNTIADFPIKFMWTPTDGNIKYRIQISQNNNFTEIIKDIETLNTEFIFETNTPKDFYYWRVKAYTIYDSSKWSAVWLVKPYNPYQKINLIYPKNGELRVRVQDTLIWQPIIGSDFYILDIATDKEFTGKVVEDQKLTNNYYIFNNFTKGKQYFWRVKCSVKNRENLWSNVWSFTIETKNSIATPKCLYPTENQIGFYVDGRLEWEQVPNARYYKLNIAKDTLFDDIVISIITSNNYFDLKNKLDYAENFYWRVAALSEIANSKWSNTYSFITELETPTLIYPNHVQTKIELIAEFSWNEVKDYTHFSLQISEDKDFIKLIYSLKDIKTNKIKLKLEKDQTYFARVKSNNYENESRWSETLIFSTGDNINSISDVGLNEILFYPNPVKSTLNLININDTQDIDLFDFKGNKIEIKFSNNQINLENLIPGTYILNINGIFHKLIKE